MGTKGKAIVNLDVKTLIKELNKALADEWLAYYQYWSGALVARGLLREAAVTELNQHAADELKHANMLAVRIIQLGGVPLTNPDDWKKEANCKYLEPKNRDVIEIIKQGVSGEQCAIDVYSKLIEKTKDKDLLTYQMLISILADEVEHEEDFETILEDMK